MSEPLEIPVGANVQFIVDLPGTSAYRYINGEIVRIVHFPNLAYEVALFLPDNRKETVTAAPHEIEVSGLVLARLEHRAYALHFENWRKILHKSDPTRAALFRPLPAALAPEWQRLVPSIDQRLEYRPCKMVMKNGAVWNRVYVQEAHAFFQVWGHWPDDARLLPIEEVQHIEASPYRLPAHLANKLYAAGETAMGGYTFVVILQDGRRVSCVTGDAIDFPHLPVGVMSDMISDVIRHERGYDQGLFVPISGTPPEIYWCFYTRHPSDQGHEEPGMRTLL